MTDLVAQLAKGKAERALRDFATYSKIAGAPMPEGFSVSRALLAIEQDPIDWRRAAPIEYEASSALAERIGRQPRPGYCFVPLELGRALTAGGGGASGGYLVDVDVTVPGAPFLAALRAASVMLNLGVAVYDGLAGNVQLPKITTGAASYWLTNETTAVTEADPVFAQIPGTPHTVGAFVQVSRQSLHQGAAQQVVMQDVGFSVAAAVDAAMIQGSGASGQPQGIIGAAGVGTQSGTSLSWAGCCDMEYAVRNAKAVASNPRLAYVGAPSVQQILSKRERGTNGDNMIWDGGKIGNVPSFATNSAPSPTLVLGAWDSVAVLSWGVLELGADPFTAFKSGLVGIRALWSIDILVRYPTAFIVAATVT